MSVDLRGFAYPLEALRRKQQWQRDAAQARLGVAEREVEAFRGELAALREEQRLAAEQCARAAAQRPDPAQHRQGLSYLAWLRERENIDKHRLVQAEKRRDDLRAQCIERQREVELGEEHRQSCLEAYRESEQVRQSAEADRDWVARRQWKATASVPTAEETQT